jgi:hypothetical protein
MSIQIGGGPIRVDSDDPQITYRGKTLAVKVRVLSWAVILGCLQQADGSWVADADLTGELFVSDVEGQSDAVAYWIDYYNGPAGFVSTVVLPRLNDWLARLFPAGEVTLTPLEQVQVVLGTIKFTPQPDGTLKASV